MNLTHLIFKFLYSETFFHCRSPMDCLHCVLNQNNSNQLKLINNYPFNQSISLITLHGPLSPLNPNQRPPPNPPAPPPLVLQTDYGYAGQTFFYSSYISPWNPACATSDPSFPSLSSSGCFRCDSPSSWRVDGAVALRGQRSAGPWVNTTGCSLITNKGLAKSHSGGREGFVRRSNKSPHTPDAQLILTQRTSRPGGDEFRLYACRLTGRVTLFFRGVDSTCPP